MVFSQEGDQCCIERFMMNNNVCLSARTKIKETKYSNNYYSDVPPRVSL